MPGSRLPRDGGGTWGHPSPAAAQPRVGDVSNLLGASGEQTQPGADARKSHALSSKQPPPAASSTEASTSLPAIPHRVPAPRFLYRAPAPHSRTAFPVPRSHTTLLYRTPTLRSHTTFLHRTPTPHSRTTFLHHVPAPCSRTTFPHRTPALRSCSVFLHRVPTPHSSTRFPHRSPTPRSCGTLPNPIPAPHSCTAFLPPCSHFMLLHAIPTPRSLPHHVPASCSRTGFLQHAPKLCSSVCLHRVPAATFPRRAPAQPPQPQDSALLPSRPRARMPGPCGSTAAEAGAIATDHLQPGRGPRAGGAIPIAMGDMARGDVGDASGSPSLRLREGMLRPTPQPCQCQCPSAVLRRKKYIPPPHPKLQNLRELHNSHHQTPGLAVRRCAWASPQARPLHPRPDVSPCTLPAHSLPFPTASRGHPRVLGSSRPVGHPAASGLGCLDSRCLRGTQGTGRSRGAGRVRAGAGREIADEGGRVRGRGKGAGRG